MKTSLLEGAIAAHSAGEVAGARARYEAILLDDPQEPGALVGLALLERTGGDLVQARALLERSVAIQPNDAQTLFNLGNVCEQLGDFHAAIRAYETSIRFAPPNGETYSNLANAYREAGRLADALDAYATAIRLQPECLALYANVGALLIELERYAEAVKILEGALLLAPQVTELLVNLGQAYRHIGRFREAIAASHLALEQCPGNRDAYLNIAACAYELDAFDEAIDALESALKIDAASAQTHYNLAWLYHATARYPQAIAANEAAIGLRPDYAEAHANLALSLLACGEFARGWNEYPWTWRLPTKRAFYPYLDRATLWNGESFVGRQVLITREQGFGDAIQFVRFAPAIKARGGCVVFEAAPELGTLFADIAGIDELRIVDNGSVVRDDVDLHVPLLGIARAIETHPATAAVAIPYLHANPERIAAWGQRMKRSARVSVGIAWAGSSGQANHLDRRRAARLEDFAALAGVGDIAWFGLQKGVDENRRCCGELHFEPLGADIHDFADTAAIIAQLDLVISVDTAIVHLAGALGAPVWTLLPFASDWRWMLAQASSPWYPTMRLFRQSYAGQWTTVFTDVARELAEFCRTHQTNCIG